MKGARLIAQELFANGIRLDAEWDAGALSKAPEWLRQTLCNLWLESIEHKAKIEVDAEQVQELGHAGAWYTAVFADMESSSLLEEIDSELLAIQTADIALKKAQRRLEFKGAA